MVPNFFKLRQTEIEKIKIINHGKVVNDVDKTNQCMPRHKSVPHQPR
jgi:hypothetical protein